jgi:hypothetical protein
MSLPSFISSPPLLRLLRQWVQLDSEPSRQDVAERLGEWLGAFESVQLDSALQSIAAYAVQARGRGQTPDGAALAASFKQLKDELTALMTTKMPSTSDAAEPVDYGRYLQRYSGLQKQMDSKIGGWRAQIRQLMGKGSPKLRQLAALDGVMAQLFGEREQKLLAAVPLYLERRFGHWRQEDDGTSLLWLQRFEQDMKQTLQAELHVRLQPLVGLIEAIQNDNRHPT